MAFDLKLLFVDFWKWPIIEVWNPNFISSILLAQKWYHWVLGHFEKLRTLSTTFYNGLHYNAKMSIDAAAGGVLMNKPYPDACALIEDMAQNHAQGGLERQNPKPTVWNIPEPWK